jgi:hypothetical protein
MYFLTIVFFLVALFSGLHFILQSHVISHHAQDGMLECYPVQMLNNYTIQNDAAHS